MGVSEVEVTGLSMEKVAKEWGDMRKKTLEYLWQ